MYYFVKYVQDDLDLDWNFELPLRFEEARKPAVGEEVPKPTEGELIVEEERDFFVVICWLEPRREDIFWERSKKKGSNSFCFILWLTTNTLWVIDFFPFRKKFLTSGLFCFNNNPENELCRVQWVKQSKERNNENLKDKLRNSNEFSMQ